MAKKKAFSFSNEADNSDSVESLDGNVYEDNGFIEGDVSFGKTLATFDFGGQLNSLGVQADNKKTGLADSKSGQADFLLGQSDNKIGQVQVDKPLPLPKGLTPPIDGEQFTVKRSYQLRPSTLRKLNEIRARHSDVNVYYNTILDEAVLHYYDYIFIKKIST